MTKVTDYTDLVAAEMDSEEWASISLEQVNQRMEYVKINIDVTKRIVEETKTRIRKAVKVNDWKLVTLEADLLYEHQNTLAKDISVYARLFHKATNLYQEAKEARA